MTFLFILSVALPAEGLWHYDLVIDPQYLEALYSDPTTEVLYPAHISCPGGESDCLVGFRGTTSLYLPKKSWRIDLFDPALIGRGRLNLDAHYRDLTMMRNHLSMELVRRMGYPAPLTRHATFSVNGVNMGVYLETERIDDDFMRRNSLPAGSVFKAVDGQARFVPFLSGTPPGEGFEWPTGDEGMLPELAALIGDVCLGSRYESRFDTDQFIANMAVNLAVMETDGPCKNYHLALGADGIWRYFPWDHDATFGNDWEGTFHAGSVLLPYTAQMQLHTLFHQVMRNPDHRETFMLRLEEAAFLMAGELSESLDSVRNAIRADVYLDPLRPGTPVDFESACDSLAWFIEERAAVTPEFYQHHRTPDSLSISVEPSWVVSGTQHITVNGYSSDSLLWCNLVLIPDGGELIEKEMFAVPGSAGSEWTLTVSGNEGFKSSLRFYLKFFLATVPPRRPLLSFPPYAVFAGTYNDEAFPSAVRVSSVPDLGALLPGTQIRLGPSLWALPLVNSGGSSMDASLCHIVLGEPAGQVFFPENLLVAPGETLFVTNNLEALSLELPGRKAVGDCRSISASGSVLTLFDPGWAPSASFTIPFGERILSPSSDTPVITEICFSQPLLFNSGDWMELHNPEAAWLDLSHTGISDASPGHMVFPAGTQIPPFGFLVLASDVDLFRAQFPGVDCQIMDMGFGLSSEGEDIRFVNRAGATTELVRYTPEPPWPEADQGIIALINPGLDQSDPLSWEAVAQPGSPGSGNPSWYQNAGGFVSLGSITPNPVRGGSLSFTLSGGSGEVQVSVIDLAGRVVHRVGELGSGQSRHTIELAAGLPPGVYFLLARSAGRISTGRFLWLP
ncbi:MAG: CotH kinase family protein [Candidatus Fermentibacteraceae bacterium]